MIILCFSVSFDPSCSFVLSARYSGSAVHGKTESTDLSINNRSASSSHPIHPLQLHINGPPHQRHAHSVNIYVHVWSPSPSLQEHRLASVLMQVQFSHALLA